MGGGAAQARWAEQADELPAWAQRGRIIFIRNEGRIPKGDEALYPQWQPVVHQHDAERVGLRLAGECRAGYPP